MRACARGAYHGLTADSLDTWAVQAEVKTVPRETRVLGDLRSPSHRLDAADSPPSADSLRVAMESRTFSGYLHFSESNDQAEVSEVGRRQQQAELHVNASCER